MMIRMIRSEPWINQSELKYRSKNRAHPEYKIVHKDKFFHVTASSNVWVSLEASRYSTTDIACTQH